MWRHCDLLPPNLLVRRGRLAAVIDFGGVGVGDPAADVIAAWSVFGAGGARCSATRSPSMTRRWARAALALHQALLIILYYPETNPEFVAMAMRTVAEVLADQPG